jgi:hypothetical protein
VCVCEGSASHHGPGLSTKLQTIQGICMPKHVGDVSSLCSHFNTRTVMIWYDIWYDMVYLLTAIGWTPDCSSTVHIYTQTIHRTKLSYRIHRLLHT